MPPLLSHLPVAVSIVQATCVSPCTLYFALRVHERLAPTFEQLDRIKGMQRGRGRSESTAGGRRFLPELPEEAWDNIKAELRRAEYAGILAEALQPLLECQWCLERDERPDEGIGHWKEWLEWAMMPTEDWDPVQESGYFCQVCGEYAEELQGEAATTDYGPLLTPYDLYAKKPSHLSTVTSSTWLALTLSSSSPRMRFDLLPDSRRPTASAHLLQLDPSSLAPPTATQLQSYGRFFREWPFVEVVRDPAYAQRALADPPWWPRLTVWHEADPELDED